LERGASEVDDFRRKSEDKEGAFGERAEDD
jgi:hypothetical protein